MSNLGEAWEACMMPLHHTRKCLLQELLFMSALS